MSCGKITTLDAREKAYITILERKFQTLPRALRMIRKICHAKDGGNLPQKNGIPSLRAIQRFLAEEKSNPLPFWKIIPVGQSIRVIPMHVMDSKQRMVTLWEERYVDMLKPRLKVNVWSFPTTLSQMVGLCWFLEEHLYERMMQLNSITKHAKEQNVDEIISLSSSSSSSSSSDDSVDDSDLSPDEEDGEEEEHATVLLPRKKARFEDRPSKDLACFEFPFELKLPPLFAPAAYPVMMRDVSLLLQWATATIRSIFCKPKMDPGCAAIESFQFQSAERIIPWMMPRSGSPTSSCSALPDCPILSLPTTIPSFRAMSKRTNKRKHQFADPFQSGSEVKRAEQLTIQMQNTFLKWEGASDLCTCDPEFIDSKQGGLPRYLFDSSWVCDRKERERKHQQQISKLFALIRARFRKRTKPKIGVRKPTTKPPKRREKRNTPKQQAIAMEVFLQAEQVKHEELEAQRFLGDETDPMMRQALIDAGDNEMRD